jgi:hypothetical protein
VSFGLSADNQGLADTVILWFFAGAWVIVLGSIVFVQFPRAFREGRRIYTRVMRLINDPPLTKELAEAEADARRLNAALERIAPLRRRAESAIATIRNTPLIPASVGEMVRRIRSEYRAFRRALR